LLTAAERVNRALVILGRETQAVQDVLDPVVEVISIVMAKQLIQAIIAGGQGFVFGLIRSACQGLCGVHQIFVRRYQFIEGTAGLFEERPAGLKSRLLPKQSDTSPGVQAHFAVVGPVLIGQQTQQRGFADAVGPDQPDPVAHVQLETDLGE
jgi:hypothetical protein